VSTLTAVLIHLDAERVRESMDLLQTVSEEARFVVCYGGSLQEFEAIEGEDKIFVDDPTLRGPEQHLQSWTRAFEALWHGFFARDESLDSLYFIEYDHLILDSQFETRLRDLAAATGADIMGKNCVDRTATNGEHYVRSRRDQRLLDHLRRLSVRADPERIFGCLGDGMWLSRQALQAYVEIAEHPPCYCETYVPTLLHHLGFRVVDVDAHSDLYRHVRWIPPFGLEQVSELIDDGAVFVHPVKDPEVTRGVRDALLRSPAGVRSLRRPR
jgi:hypothetical protein